MSSALNVYENRARVHENKAQLYELKFPQPNRKSQCVWYSHYVRIISKVLRKNSYQNANTCWIMLSEKIMHEQEFWSWLGLELTTFWSLDKHLSYLAQRRSKTIAAYPSFWYRFHWIEAAQAFRMTDAQPQSFDPGWNSNLQPSVMIAYVCSHIDLNIIILCKRSDWAWY